MDQDPHGARSCTNTVHKDGPFSPDFTVKSALGLLICMCVCVWGGRKGSKMADVCTTVTKAPTISYNLIYSEFFFSEIFRTPVRH